MINIIYELFKHNNYISIDVDGGVVFKGNDQSAKKSYWLVVHETDLALFIERQSNLFKACKNSIKETSLDKNISVLIVWETGGELNINDMKKSVMTVEEDPYFFKKHVLYFSKNELDSLVKEIGDDTLTSFLQNNISSRHVFNKYKENPLSQEWQTLLYRISIKISFIDVDIGLSDGLTSLFESNQAELEASRDGGLADFDRYFFKIQEPDVSAEKLLEVLSPLLEGNNNGD